LELVIWRNADWSHVNVLFTEIRGMSPFWEKENSFYVSENEN
jgi:hypothetical protein